MKFDREIWNEFCSVALRQFPFLIPLHFYLGASIPLLLVTSPGFRPGLA